MKLFLTTLLVWTGLLGLLLKSSIRKSRFSASQHTAFEHPPKFPLTTSVSKTGLFPFRSSSPSTLSSTRPLILFFNWSCAFRLILDLSSSSRLLSRSSARFSNRTSGFGALFCSLSSVFEIISRLICRTNCGVSNSRLSFVEGNSGRSLKGSSNRSDWRVFFIGIFCLISFWEKFYMN